YIYGLSIAGLKNQCAHMARVLTHLQGEIDERYQYRDAADDCRDAGKIRKRHICPQSPSICAVVCKTDCFDRSGEFFQLRKDCGSGENGHIAAGKVSATIGVTFIRPRIIEMVLRHWPGLTPGV
ncbi:MAG: hypothetical protein JST16_04145, partial [Bdellovibrionales bacterium]|nr:hypothetical protein [Bdellovibrionales bacterium]